MQTRTGKDILVESVKYPGNGSESAKKLYYLFFYIKFILPYLRKTQDFATYKDVDKLFGKLDDELGKKSYVTIDEVMGRNSERINELIKLIDKPGYLYLFNLYFLTKPEQINYNDALTVLQSIFPKLSEFESKPAVTQLSALHKPNIAHAIEAVNRFDEYRKTTYKHVFNDFIHRSHKDKKSIHAKLGRSSQFRRYLSILDNEEKSEDKKLDALIELTRMTEFNIDKSGNSSKFRQELETNLKPFLINMCQELTRIARNKQDERYDKALSELSKIYTEYPRKKYAKELKKYIDTINYDIKPNRRYFQNAGRMFIHLMQPKKRDELNRFLKGIYSDILSGKVDQAYFARAEESFKKINKDNPQVMKILHQLKEEFYNNKAICEFSTSQTDSPTVHDARSDESIEKKRKYLVSKIDRNIYSLLMGYLVMEGGIFQRTGGEAGEVASYLGLVDLNVLNTVAPGITSIQTVTDLTLRIVGNYIQDNEAKSVSDIRPRDFHDISEKFGNLIADRFAVQLESLYDTGTYHETLDRLVQNATKYAISNLGAEEFQSRLATVTSPEEVAEVLLDSMLESSFRMPISSSLPLDKLRKELDHVDDKGMRNDNQQWTVDGLFQKTGYVVEDKKGNLVFYKPHGTEPEKYGYAFLTERQAKEIKREAYPKVDPGDETRKKYEKIYKDRMPISLSSEISEKKSVIKQNI